MSDWNLPWDGGCRCGEVRFRVTSAPLVSNACHCLGCQRMTASAFSLGLLAPAAGFEIVKGDAVRGGLRATVRHFHCPSCMSWLFTRWGDAGAFVNVQAMMLDEHAWYAPFYEVQTAEKLPWAVTGAPHSYERWADPSDYPRLMAAYDAQAARP